MIPSHEQSQRKRRELRELKGLGYHPKSRDDRSPYVNKNRKLSEFK